jgi:membrane-bound lytic murein transglycosylase MltF
MSRSIALFAALLAATTLVFAQAPAANKSEAPPPTAGKARQFDVRAAQRRGDFDMMLEQRVIRVNVPYSRTLYFVDKGTERGISADTVRDFERWLNRKYAKQLGKRPLTVVVRVATRDQLFSNLREGYADIAVGSIGVTEERQKLVDFVSPADMRKSRVILVTGPGAPAVASLDELSGRRVHVRKSSVAYEDLVALNARLRQAGKPPLNLALVPEAMEDDDLMEMANTGLVEAMFTPDWAARMWAPVLPRIKVRDDVALREGAGIGWAIRKDSPHLAAEIEAFYAQSLQKQRVIESRLQQYMKRIKQIQDPTRSAEYQRFRETVALFEKYGGQYGFDPLMLAAQGYQESALNQQAKSPVGAIGVMQIMPATGVELKVGDIRVTEPNIHGGAKYMDQLMTKYFPDAKFDEQNRTLFAFASYNCGPGNVSKMRKEAEKRGLDPNVWFNNVEVVTAEKIGLETTTYVRNIFKYYVAYKLETDARAQREKVKQEVAPARK